MNKYFFAVIAAIIAVSIMPQLVAAETIIRSSGASNFSEGIYTNQLCINGNCQTEWPTGISGLTTNGVLYASNSTNATTGNMFYYSNGSGQRDYTYLAFNNNRSRVAYEDTNLKLVAGTGKGILFYANDELAVNLDSGREFDVYSSPLRVFGRNGTANTSAGFAVWGTYQGDDGTGARARGYIEIRNCDPEITGGIPCDEVSGTEYTTRSLSIQCHLNITGGQGRECSFYSNLKYNVSSGKAFQWKTGPNSNGVMEFTHLNRLEFPESYTGYYSNLSNNGAGLDSNDPDFSIYLDVDNDSTGEEFRVYAGDSNFSVGTPLLTVGRTSDGKHYVSINSTDTTALLNIGSGSNNGDILFINGERDWKLNLSGTGVSTELNLVDMGNAKNFNILSQVSGNKVATFIAHDTNGSERVYLAMQGGRVGINTTTPNANLVLDVRGGANFSTILYTPNICLNGDCRTSWPAGGSGGANASVNLDVNGFSILANGTFAVYASAKPVYGDYNFLIWRNGSIYVAQSNNGTVLTSSSSAHVVINAAINNITTSLYGGGGKVVFSCQEFLITDSIMISKPYITLSGCGSGTHVNASGMSSKAMINITGTSTVHVTVRDLFLNAQSATSVTCLNINTPYGEGDTEHLISNIKCWEPGLYGFSIYGDTRVVQMDNLYVRTAYVDGFRIGGSDHKFEKLTSEGAYCNGFYIESSNTHILNSKAFGNGRSNTGCHGMIIYGRLVHLTNFEAQDNYNYGVFTDSSSAYGVSIIGSVFDTNGRNDSSSNDKGIRAYAAKDWSITGNSFINRDGNSNMSGGMSFGGSVINMTVVGNTFAMNGQASIEFDSSADRRNVYRGFNTGSNETILMPGLSGSGTDYLCVDADGQFVRSNLVC